VRPYVIIFVTQSIDGKIASVRGYSKLSCPEDKRRQYWLRCRVDGVVVGANTVIIDNPRLYPKIFEKRGKYFRIVIDGVLRVPVDARIFDTSDYGTIVLTTAEAPKDKVMELKARGVNVEIVSEKPPVDLRRALKTLYERYGIESLMVEGGGETIWNFVREGLFDEFRVTITSRLFGGRNAVSSVGGEGFEGPESPTLELAFVGICVCRSEVHLIYRNTNPSIPPTKVLSIGTLDNFWKTVRAV